MTRFGARGSFVSAATVRLAEQAAVGPQARNGAEVETLATFLLSRQSFQRPQRGLCPVSSLRLEISLRRSSSWLRPVVRGLPLA